MSELALAVFAASRDAHATDRDRTLARASRGSSRRSTRRRTVGGSGRARLPLARPLRSRRFRPCSGRSTTRRPGCSCAASATAELLSPAVGRDRRRAGAAATTARTSRARSRASLAAAGVVVVSGLARGVDGWAHRGVPRSRRGDGRSARLRHRSRLSARACRPRAARSASTGLIVSRVPARRRAGAVALSGAEPDRRRARARDGGRRGARAKRGADHGRSRARGGARGARRPRRDHVALSTGYERAPPARRDAGHVRRRRARGDRRRAADSDRSDPRRATAAAQRCSRPSTPAPPPPTRSPAPQDLTPALPRRRLWSSSSLRGLVEVRAGIYRR